MSHQEKQEIFDQYAEQQGYADWSDLKSELYNESKSSFQFCEDIDEHIFAACDLVQEKLQKRIKERISNSEFQKGHPVDISSIINPENLIK